MTMRRNNKQAITGFMFIASILLGSGCTYKPYLLQFSPDAELSMAPGAGMYWGGPPANGHARLISKKPPGKPMKEVATLSSVPELWITHIQSEDGTVFFKSPDPDSLHAAMVGSHSLGIRPNVLCQLPEGNYEIGSRFLKYSSPYERVDRKYDGYITVNLRKGNVYEVGYNDFSGIGMWKLTFKELEKIKGTEGLKNK